MKHVLVSVFFKEVVQLLTLTRSCLRPKMTTGLDLAAEAVLVIFVLKLFF